MRKRICDDIRRKIISPITKAIENIHYYLKHREHPVLSKIGWLAVILFFTCAVPLILDWAFETPAIFPILAVKWDVKDALSFYGDVLGAAATIFVLQRTIKFTVENQKDERKASIKPYLETKKYNYTDVLKIPADQEITFLNISKRGITYQGALPEDIMDLRILQARMQNELTIDPFEQAAFDLRIDTLMKQKYYLYYEVSNCGAGNAINVHLYINDNPMLPSFCVTTETPKKFMFILNSDLIGTDTNEYTHRLLFTYDDIASLARYRQSEYIIFSRNNSNNLKTFQQSGSLLTKPIEIPKEVRING